MRVGIFRPHFIFVDSQTLLGTCLQVGTRRCWIGVAQILNGLVVREMSLRR
jgi:hypothetical protein